MAYIILTHQMMNIEPEDKYTYLCEHLIRSIVFLNRELNGIAIREQEIKEETNKSMLITRKRRLRACYELVAMVLPVIRYAFNELEKSIHGIYVIENTEVGQEYQKYKDKYPAIITRIKSPSIKVFDTVAMSKSSASGARRRRK